jgi:hypothetical protein
LPHNDPLGLQAVAAQQTTGAVNDFLPVKLGQSSSVSAFRLDNGQSGGKLH